MDNTGSGNFNYQAYKILDRLKGKTLRMIPNRLISRNAGLGANLQIAVTTYVDRYELFFKPLYYSLRKIFPDVNIYTAVNGFHDHDIQSKYLQRLQSELCESPMDGCTFILHDQPVGLTRLWNELLSQGSATTTLILNDDLEIYPWLRCWTQKGSWGENITLVNGSWSHFFISKHVLKTVGWFDEDFKGIGFEDMDYTARCALSGIPIDNLSCQYIKHLDHQPVRTSFDTQSTTMWGPKYSSMNHDSFFRKWRKCSHNSGIFIKQINSFVEPVNIRLLESRQASISLAFRKGICFPDRI
jgi:hypothetical protein